MRCAITSWLMWSAALAGGCFAEFDDPNFVEDLEIEPAPRTCRPEAEIQAIYAVLDGDTFDADTTDEDFSPGFEAERIRLLGLDTPEVGKNGEPDECFAQEALDETERLLNEAENARLEFDRGEDCAGVFGRTLAYVYVDVRDGDREQYDPQDLDQGFLFLNAHLVRTGLARLYRNPDPSIPDPEELIRGNQLLSAERSAQVSNIGLWSACE